jgi:hypothetical protein
MGIDKQFELGNPEIFGFNSDQNNKAKFIVEQRRRKKLQARKAAERAEQEKKEKLAAEKSGDPMLSDKEQVAGQLLAQGLQKSGDDTTAGAGDVLSGALAGSQFGVKGALIGAGVGTIGAIAGVRSKRKERRRKAKAAAFKEIASIEQTAGAQRQAAISNIISGLRSAFLGR